MSRWMAVWVSGITTMITSVARPRANTSSQSWSRAAALVRSLAEDDGLGWHALDALANGEASPESVRPDGSTSKERTLRHYGLGAQVLQDLGVAKIRLLTNSPRKLAGLQGYGLEVVDCIPLSE